MTAATLKPYLVERIRRPPPEGCFVIPWSPPVVAFGAFRTAWLASIGINPSVREFRDEDGRELVQDRRLPTFRSLAIDRLEATPLSVAETIVEECESYFAPTRKPYPWFKSLDRIFSGAGASYYDGTACHLDLVPWATERVWKRATPLKPSLTAAARRKLLADGVPFLLAQLEQENITALVVNGAAVIDELRRYTPMDLRELSAIQHGCGTRVYCGELGRTKVVAWTVNVQSSRNVTTELKQAIADVCTTHLTRG